MKRIDLRWAQPGIVTAPREQLEEALPEGGKLEAGMVMIQTPDGRLRLAAPHEIPPHIAELQARARAGEFADA